MFCCCKNAKNQQCKAAAYGWKQKTAVGSLYHQPCKMEIQQAQYCVCEFKRCGDGKEKRVLQKLWLQSMERPLFLL